MKTHAVADAVANPVAKLGATFVLLAAMTGAMAQGPTQASDTNGNRTASGTQAKSSDRQIAKSVRRAIRQGGGVDMAALTVRVKGGVVTLAGSVPSADEATKAAEAARKVNGVVDVRNRLTVQTQEN
jgi:hyperosmotically inducible periplasmic protein